MVIGVDFDNTILNYDAAFFYRALELGLISNGQGKHKRELRDQVRLLPDGEILWQQLQSYVYTQGMAKAYLIDGVKDFFVSCKQAGIQTYIVSHKTQYASLAPEKINLRQIALDWMGINGFFKSDVLGLDVSEVYFESTRSEKIGRIKTLGCTHFIDDLQEVFLESAFPLGVEKILYAPDSQRALGKDIIVLDSWKSIYEYFFNRV